MTDPGITLMDEQAQDDLLPEEDESRYRDPDIVPVITVEMIREWTAEQKRWFEEG